MQPIIWKQEIVSSQDEWDALLNKAALYGEFANIKHYIISCFVYKKIAQITE